MVQFHQQIARARGIFHIDLIVEEREGKAINIYTEYCLVRGNCHESTEKKPGKYKKETARLEVSVVLRIRWFNG